MSCTTVIGCSYTTDELKFTRFEHLVFVSIAFDLPGRIVFYTRTLDYDVGEDEMEEEKKILREALGSLWDKEHFGKHELNGGEFESVIPLRSSNVVEIQSSDDPLDYFMASSEEFSSENSSDDVEENTLINSIPN